MSIAIKEVNPTDYTVIEVLSTETVPVEILSTEPINTVGENAGKVLIVEGEKGDPFTFEDFTPEQLEQLKGEKGDPFVYSDFTEEQLANLKGEAGYTPQKGVDYFDGYTPQKGIDYFDGYTPIKGVDYFDGKDGYTPIKGVDYFDGKDGTVSFDDLTDEQKESLKGADGYTPIKGVDYFDGYTPVKGVDYFDGEPGKDGEPGYTPQKGIDYFDGTDGKDGLTTSVNGKEQVNGKITLNAADVGALSTQGGTVSGNITIERTNYPGFALKNNTAGSMMTVSAADDGVAIFQNEKGSDYTTLYVRPPSEGIDNALQLGNSQNGAWVGAVVLHNRNFASHISAGAIGAETAGAVSAHNADANAHSGLFAGKANSPTAVTVDSYANFTVADNCEYRLTNLSTLIMAGSTAKAHGFVYFGSSAPSVSVTGFTGTSGDDVASAGASQVWEFSCDNGYILWKNWSA